MKTFSKILSVLLALAVVISIMPLPLVHVHAEDFSWNDSAVMTLTSGGVEVTPTNVIETEDTKLKVYTIYSENEYVLTTSADNDYAVLFDVVLTQIGEDSYGDATYDEEIDITLDNVTIKTINPRQDIIAQNYAAMSFMGNSSTIYYNNINITLTGNNTVELLGVKNDTDTDVWSAINVTDAFAKIGGSGTLNAKCAYENAVGDVAAIRSNYNFNVNDSVTINAVADVTSATAGEYAGDGISITTYHFTTNADTTVNITASASGIESLVNSYSLLTVGGKMNIKAADYGVNWQTYKLILNDNAQLTVEGLNADTAPNVGILTQRGVEIGANCKLDVKALNEAFSCKATTTENHSAPIEVGQNSVVNVRGSIASEAFAIDCGIKAASNNSSWGQETYPAAILELLEGAKVTVNADYRAIQAILIKIADGAELNVTTNKQMDSEDAYDYAPVHLQYYTSYIYSGGKLVINSAAKVAVYSGTLNIQSNDVYITATEKAITGTSLTRGTGIYTFECDDGINWVPFNSSSKGKPYFTTENVGHHICYGPTYTQVEGTYTHSCACIYCGEATIQDCVWDRGSWSYVSSGVYELKFRCDFCDAERVSDVEYHSHVYETWTPLTGTVNPQHESYCTYEGCEASTTSYCSNSYGDEYHISPTTLRKDCTKCGQYSTREIEAGTSTHFEAKSGSCNTPGNIEYYNCGHCNQYYADESFTTKLSPTEVFTTPTPHNYDADGVCTVCGNKAQELSFFEFDENPYEEYNGYNCIIVGKASDGTMYVLGNETTDGKRNAVEITSDKIDENGNIKISSADAEYLLYDNANWAFVVDGGYLSLLDGKIYVYDPARKDDANISIPATYQAEDYYDESGLGYMQAYISGKYAEREYLVFNAETLKFEVSDTQLSSLYLYVEKCEHQNMFHNKAVAATCTEQGVIEYWYCGKCHEYYSNAQGTALLEIPEDSYNVEEYLTQPALGHKYNEKDVCENCGIKRPVYKQVSTLEDFDKLSGNASYIIVIKDGDKTYAASLPTMQNPCDNDSDGDGIVDAIEIDENGNTVPDSFELMYNNWGMGDYNGDEVIDQNDYIEWIGDLNEDTVIDVEDHKLFLEYNYWDISNIYEQEAMNADNFVEVTMSEDGSITVVDEGAMEFNMVISGVWGGQPSMDGSYEADWEYHGILDTERVRAAWVPNYWIANSGQMGYYSKDHFMIQNRIYGDSDYPGIIDNKNWKISFNEDGTACLVSTWADFDDSAALQFVKYTDSEGQENMTIVGMYGEQWESSEIMINKTAALPVYLFASEAEYAHTHVWGDWTADDVTDTHTRRCTIDNCTAKQTESHEWDDGVQTTDPTCTEQGVITYTCSVCTATKTSSVNQLGHDWGDWVSVDDNTHRRDCNACDDFESTEHNFGDAIKLDDNSHKFVCADCYHELVENHKFGDCINDRNETTHTAECVCGATVTNEHNFDEGTVVEEPTHTEEGIKTYTCTDCGATKDEAISKTPDHKFGNWIDNGDGTHSRKCACDESETADHNFDDGTVVEEPTHTEEGIKTYTCTDCGATKDEAISKTPDHEFGNWLIDENSENQHYRACDCGEKEFANCKLGEGKVVIGPSDFSENDAIIYVCIDCNRQMVIESIATTDSVTNEEENVTISVPEESSALISADTVLQVTKTENSSDETVQENLQETIGENTEQISTFDISMLVNGVEVQPGGDVKVNIPLPNDIDVNDYSTITVVYIDDNGNITPCETVVNDDGTVTFVTNHFSTYAIVGISAIEYGDVNGDGKINGRDYTLILQSINGWSVTINSKAADANGDGKVNGRDYTIVLQSINGWPVTLGPKK